MISTWPKRVQFNHRSTSIFDEDPPRRPNKVTTWEISEIIDIMTNDWRVQMREIVETVDISIELVQNISTTYC